MVSADLTYHVIQTAISVHLEHKKMRMAHALHVQQIVRLVGVARVSNAMKECTWAVLQPVQLALYNAEHALTVNPVICVLQDMSNRSSLWTLESQMLHSVTSVSHVIPTVKLALFSPFDAHHVSKDSDCSVLDARVCSLLSTCTNSTSTIWTS